MLVVPGGGAISITWRTAIGGPRHIPAPRLQTDQSYVDGAVALLVQGLAAQGVPQAVVERAFESAVASSYPPTAPVPLPLPAEPSPPPLPAPSVPPPATTGFGELRQPATVTAANQAFRAAFTQTKRPPVKSVTQKFIRYIVEDRACVYGFEYNAIYALGFTALCDAFLGASCRNDQDVAATRSALCFALGLDEDRVATDARELSTFAEGKTEAELLACDPLAQIASATTPPKYTYAFGVGLVLLMVAAGESKISGRDSFKYGAQYNAVEPGGGAIERWCTALNLNFAQRLESDFARPLSVDGIGRFSFESESSLEDSTLVLESIGREGSF